MTKYIGLTIGPIYKTLTSVKKTREFWGASYIFSYLMKEIIKSLKNQNGIEFILPAIDENLFKDVNDIEDKDKDKYLGVGSFHDRFILKSEESSFEKVKNSVNDEIVDFSCKVANHLNKDCKKVEEFMKKYFSIYFCEVESDEKLKIVNKEMNKYLDNLELQEKFISKPDKNYLSDFLNDINKSFLIEDAWGRKSDNRKSFFNSIIEIATKELHDKISDNDIFKKNDEDIITEIKREVGKDFKPYHKYIAIIQADGDKMGDTIENLKNNEEFKKVSNSLLKFTLEANKQIRDFGGMPIFAGGDDLLFFAPVVCKGKNVFELVNEISETFNDIFTKTGLKTVPTASFGVSISYYKYPMKEALDSAGSLLFDKAKKHPNKNSIAFKLLKHSGQNAEAIISKGGKVFTAFKALTSEKIEKNIVEKILSSITHKIMAQGVILKEIGNDEDKLENFFDNNFNEKIHKDNKEFINKLREVIFSVFSSEEYEKKEEEGKEEKYDKLEIIDAIFRTNKFLKGGE